MNCERGFIGKEIRGKKFGIPVDVFNHDYFSDQITTLSGLKLDCNITPNKIVIAEPHADSAKQGKDYCHFSAEVNFGCLTLSAYTKVFKGKQKYHPDLFSSKLIEESFAFFDRHGVEIKNVFCCWETPNDSYKQFEAALDLGSNPEPINKVQFEATKEVSEAKQIAKFGFTKLDKSAFIWINIPGKEEVLCEFTREPGSLGEV